MTQRDFERKIVKLVKVRILTYTKNFNTKTSKFELNNIFVHYGSNSDCEIFLGIDTFQKALDYFTVLKESTDAPNRSS